MPSHTKKDSRLPAPDSLAPCAVHLLDVGQEEYGDAILCQFGAVSVLIDGAHTGDWNGSGDHAPLPTQIEQLLGVTAQPARVTLLIVTHAHEDHIGCLPHLVQHGMLAADWALVADPGLGWGRTVSEGTSAPTDERVARVVAALREEPRALSTDAPVLEQFLSDAASLESRYLGMLEKLAADGTKVIRYPDPTQGETVKELLHALETQGVLLKILGPTPLQALHCAQLIRDATQVAAGRVQDLLQTDAALTAEEMYRELNHELAADAPLPSRPGPPINLQSLVTCFTYREQKFLFAGDMQFVKPQVSQPEIINEVTALRQRVGAEAPYTFAKISHHGSDNAFSAAFLQELGATPFLGICAGEKSTAHPHPATLAALAARRDNIDWARTDHNRLASFDFTDVTPVIKLERGSIDDAQPNTDAGTRIGAVTGTAGTGVTTGVALPVPPPVPAPTPVPVPAVPALAPVAPVPPLSYVEVTTRVPHTATRVTVTIDVAPGAAAVHEPAPAQPISTPNPATGADTLPVLRLAGGRVLPPLLFVTCRSALAANIGQAECEHVLQAMNAQGWQVLDTLLPNAPDTAQTALVVRQVLQNNPHLKGVVLLGGYDVVPAQRLDCLPPELRAQISAQSDPDRFIVWSDSIYGDRDGDGLPELPVSRIPDGRSAQLVFAALQAGARPALRSRLGVRNVQRPFADEIYQLLPGAEPMQISAPATYNHPLPYTLDADCVYLMLHGDFVDSKRFWGEGTPQNQEAVNLGNLPLQAGEVIFTGCCWGALIVDTPAGRVVAGRGWGTKTVEDSLALSFLLRGAKAFIGCTGVHYSPGVAPYNYFGGPMHQAFWQQHRPGQSPATSLFEAKKLYLLGMHQRAVPGSSALSLAIEYKILRQYSCLGLGW